VLKFIFIMVFVFFLAYFGATNPQIVQINFFGRTSVSIPFGFFVFITFFLGAIFSAFLVFFEQIKKAKLIRNLKKELNELKTNFAEKVRKEVEELRIKEIKEELSGMGETFEEEVSSDEKKEKQPFDDTELKKTLQREDRDEILRRILKDREKKR